MAWGETDKKAEVESKFSQAQEPVKEEKAPKPTGPRDEFIQPEIRPVQNCTAGKRVSKGKTGNVRALMKICGGWCIGRSPGAKEWIDEDLPLYDH